MLESGQTRTREAGEGVAVSTFHRYVALGITLRTGAVLTNTLHPRQSSENESDRVWCVERTLRLVHFVCDVIRGDGREEVSRMFVVKESMRRVRS